MGALTCAPFDMDLSRLRQDYRQSELNRRNLKPDPIDQFQVWFDQAIHSEILEPNAMVLGTVSPQGCPYSRTVLLKYFDRSGFVFYTNYTSRKATHMDQNPQVSLLFVWLPLERQIHITGTATKVSTAESLRYFMSRPRDSQIGAWCSPQSQIISSRSLLIKQYESMKQKFQNRQIPLPDAWGGYRVKPDSVEFWQGRQSRLHDRFLYERQADDWVIHRLAP